MNALRYVSPAQARGLPGLRLVLTQGIPAPWGFAARALFDIKNIPFVAAVQEAGQPNEELRDWTGQTSAPCAMLDEERPRAHWLEILLLAERLAPEPRLIPLDEDARIDMLGLCTEICSEDGLGWNLRVLLLEAQRAAGAIRYPTLLQKYSSGMPAEHARARLNQIVDMLARRLGAQRASGSDYFAGDELTAADIYWTGFSNLFDPMDEALCPMPASYRSIGTATQSFLDGPVDPILIEHRNMIVTRHLKTPLRF